jgi:cobalamin synthase
MSLLAALGLFTVLPVPAGGRNPGAGVLAWLPVVGVLLAVLAYLPALAVWRGGGEGSPFLAAALAVAAFALLTRGLHLDGTADLADGLGSGRPAEQASAIMRRPDVGAFGVVAVSTTLLVQVAGLSAVLAGSSRQGRKSGASPARSRHCHRGANLDLPQSFGAGRRGSADPGARTLPPSVCPGRGYPTEVVTWTRTRARAGRGRCR